MLSSAAGICVAQCTTEQDLVVPAYRAHISTTAVDAAVNLDSDFSKIVLLSQLQ
jgi:hypothetical protein